MSITSVHAVRACIFDMDGLLINTEDIITVSTNKLLAKYGRPALTRSIRAQLMGVPDSTNGDIWHPRGINDGWTEMIPTLGHFDYKKYGIIVP